MMFRSMIVGAAVVLLMGCPRPKPTPDAGCVGIACPPTGGGAPGGGGGGSTGGGSGGGSQGGGTGGGTGGAQGGGTGGSQGGGTGGGSTDDGGIPTTVGEAKGTSYPHQVDLQGVVVTAVSFARPSAASTACAGGTSKGVTADFWVADPANAENGVWVRKFRCDRDVDYFPQVGDVLNISGVIGFESGFNQRTGYRTVVKSEFDYIPNRPSGYVCELSSAPACEPLVITKTGTMAPLPVVDQPITFGNNGGFRAEQALKGARIKIAGPLTISDATPEALHRVTADAGDTTYYGYRLSNGVLVNDFRTFDNASLEDGGRSHCDQRWIVLDGGTVMFPNGIIGVWDTYTFASCVDGGTDIFNCFANRGTVPPDADAGYTNVLYPTDCADLTP